MSVGFRGPCESDKPASWWRWPTGSIADRSRLSAGLLSCYVAAIPFIHQTILADLAGTAVLFGSEAILERAYRLLPARGASLHPENPPAA